MKKALSFVAALIFALSVSTWVCPQAQAVSSPLKLFSFQMGGVYASVSGDTHLSPEIAWTPILSLGPIGLRGEFGASYFKTTVLTISESYLVTNYEVFLQLSLLPMIGIEGGAGFQKWHTTGTDMEFVATGNVTLDVPGGTIDRIYVGFSRLFATVGVNEFRAGVGFTL